MKVIVRQCRNCGCDMVAGSAYRMYRALRDQYTRCGSHGFCTNCSAHIRRHGGDPAGPVPPRTQFEPIRHGQPCRDCQRPLLPQSLYRSDIPRYKPLGYVSLGGHGMCVACYRWARTHQTLPDPGPPRPEPPVRLGPHPDDDGPLHPAELARLRAIHGVG